MVSENFGEILADLDNTKKAKNTASEMAKNNKKYKFY